VTTLKLHYDGWPALPAAFRQKLGLSKGTALEAELVGGTIVLRPAAAGLKRPARTETEELGHSAATAMPVTNPKVRLRGSVDSLASALLRQGRSY
jgi:bifunctional DNA-binding transcriptional regulator/antitoxin component of YhaV-PrlF toxin-antitoxin module